MKCLNLILAALMLLCLFPMPYGFYTLMRFGAMVAFAWMSYGYWQKKKDEYAIVFGALALLFQPFVKIALGRTVWNIVDVTVAILLVWIWLKNKKETHE